MEPVVLHHPSDHLFVRHLGLTHSPALAATPVWDVDAMVALGIQVVHVHFGFEHLTPDELRAWLDRLRDVGIALVHTVHDIDNPHLEDQGAYHRLGAHLVEAAAVVMTLTPTAAREIRSRYQREALVVPHPHVVPLEELARRARRLPVARHGVYAHAATLRPNLDVELIGRLAGAARAIGGMHVHIRHGAPATVRQRLADLVTSAGATVDVGPRPDDGELWRRLGTAALVVLPYRWGTHSGLLEAAHDLGTPTLAPAFGGYGDQGASLLDTEDLAGSMRRAIDAPPATTLAERRRRRRSIAAVHRYVYHQLVRTVA
ncbi:MAG: glycosyltransferase [Acidimicrobiia bacterium]|nr:glycosyltransferase [Acidimicrobiia bacterium]